MIQANRIYLIFNLVHFLVDSSEPILQIICALYVGFFWFVVFQQFLLTVSIHFQHVCKRQKNVLKAEKIPFETVITTVLLKTILPTGNEYTSFYQHLI